MIKYKDLSFWLKVGIAGGFFSIIYEILGFIYGFIIGFSSMI